MKLNNEQNAAIDKVDTLFKQQEKIKDELYDSMFDAITKLLDSVDDRYLTLLNEFPTLTFNIAGEQYEVLSIKNTEDYCIFVEVNKVSTSTKSYWWLHELSLDVIEFIIRRMISIIENGNKFNKRIKYTDYNSIRMDLANECHDEIIQLLKDYHAAGNEVMAFEKIISIRNFLDSDNTCSEFAIWAIKLNKDGKHIDYTDENICLDDDINSVQWFDDDFADHYPDDIFDLYEAVYFHLTETKKA